VTRTIFTDVFGDWMLPLREYSHFAVSLLAVMSPLGALPVFLSNTEGLSSKETSRTAIVATWTAASVLVAAALMGQSILPMLGISLGSLQIAGGLVMLTMGLSRLQARDVPAPPSAEPDPSAGLVPLGFPVLAGPGSISSVMVAIRAGSGAAHATVVIGCVLAACGAVWAVLRTARPIGAYLGRRGLNALSRVFAFLLAAIAVGIISAGLRSLFPVLG
jgi:multiple antibiotic resistance protein